jgi:hypothetical protein
MTPAQIAFERSWPGPHDERYFAGLAALALPDSPEYVPYPGTVPAKPTNGGTPMPPAQEPTPRPIPRNVATSTRPADADDWIVDGLLRPGAILVVASPEGLGKSQVRKELAVRLTTCGGSLFGHYPILRTCTVLEVDEENGPSEEWRREEQVLAALEVSRADAAGYWSVSYAGLNLGNDESRQYLAEQVAATRPGVLMLDTGTSMVGEEWGAELKAAIRFLRSLTVEYGCAIVVFVHFVKPPRDNGRAGGRLHGGAITDVMGQWTRQVDAVGLMADLGEGRAAWSTFKKVPKSELTIVRASGLWRVVHVGADHKLSSDNRVLRAIVAGGGGPDELAQALGLSTRAVSGAVARLRKDGLLGPGFPYAATPEGMEAMQ